MKIRGPTFKNQRKSAAKSTEILSIFLSSAVCLWTWRVFLFSTYCHSLGAQGYSWAGGADPPRCLGALSCQTMFTPTPTSCWIPLPKATKPAHHVPAGGEEACHPIPGRQGTPPRALQHLHLDLLGGWSGVGVG